MTTLTLAQLNRATLARQMLLERQDMGILEATEQLVGMQGQVTTAPYVALWSRLNGFEHAAMTELILARKLVRATTMRATLHLHTARDLIDLRALVQSVPEKSWQGAHAKHFGKADKAEVLAAGRALLDAGPMTNGALGKALAERWPESDPLALALWVAVSETLVQIPPTRIWGSGHAPLLTRVQNWLQGPYEGRKSREDMVLRYLAAFGPASVADMQAWCGLTRLDTSFAALGDKLLRFEDENGRVLFDLPDAQRPAAETPAPVRFLPDYDNILIGYADRSRFIDAGGIVRISRGNGFRPVLIVDGVAAATWRLVREKKAAMLEIDPFRPFTRRERLAVEAEGEAFVVFLAEEVEDRGVGFVA
jgi:hypothetical protein